MLISTGGCCFGVTLLFRPTVANGPEATAALASKILDWQLPSEMQGEMGMTMDNALVGVKIAKFKHGKGRGFLVIGQWQEKMVTGQWQSNLFKMPDQRTQANELIEKVAPELKKLKIDERQSRKLSIRGLPGEFEIGSGEDRASTTRFREVTGFFRGKVDNVLLILQYEEGVMSDEEIDRFLNSIK